MTHHYAQLLGSGAAQRGGIDWMEEGGKWMLLCSEDQEKEDEGRTEELTTMEKDGNPTLRKDPQFHPEEREPE